MESNMKKITATEILQISKLAITSENNTKAYKSLINKIDENVKNGYKAFDKTGHLNNNRLIIDDVIYLQGTEKKIYNAMIKHDYIDLKLKDIKTLENDWRNYWGTIINGYIMAIKNRKEIEQGTEIDLMSFWLSNLYKPYKVSIYHEKLIYDDTNKKNGKFKQLFNKRFESHEEREEWQHKRNNLMIENERIKKEQFKIMINELGLKEKMAQYDSIKIDDNNLFDYMDNFYSRIYETNRRLAS